jgi:hypothetical protein
MVSMLGVSLANVAAWIAQTQAEQPLILRLEPKDRVRVFAALMTVVILGLALILFVWWGARVTRRYMNSATQARRRRQTTTVREDDWATKPLYAADDDVSQEEE